MDTDCTFPRRPFILGAMPQTAETTRPGGPGTGLGPSWRVIVCNDDHNTFDHVARTLSRVIPGVSLSRGHEIAGVIHNAGRATVFAGHREAAEHYWDQLKGAGLTMAPLEQG
jgi:ATP-dependent Clp protease adaptor protein ClpS